ncbi:hypothetical protein [Streptosporangium saharense]|uniref:Uncharacterized protein n=1 Tax=Streptosporangium saharense TaxID=1706840 RepID=A0A7W7VSK5_9ACTN|nr:hypothetical protein [Streptosporangium saharense]MBB4920520.1 hypothetical protein [Streptosporangium saharense]
MPQGLTGKCPHVYGAAAEDAPPYTPNSEALSVRRGAVRDHAP